MKPSKHRRAAVRVTWLGLIIVAGGWWWAQPSRLAPPKPEASPSLVINPVLQWHGEQNHWLIVSDRGAGELVIYDADSGQPVHRFGPAPVNAGTRAMAAR